MNDYVPSPNQRAAEQVELYESTDGREGNTMRGMPVIILTHRGRKSGAVRKTPLMRVADGDGRYVVVASLGRDVLGVMELPEWGGWLSSRCRDGPARRLAIPSRTNRRAPPPSPGSCGTP